MELSEEKQVVEGMEIGNLYEFTMGSKIIVITFIGDLIKVSFEAWDFNQTLIFKSSNAAACNSLESATIIADYIYNVVRCYGLPEWIHHSTKHHLFALEKAGVKNIFVVLR